MKSLSTLELLRLAGGMVSDLPGLFLRPRWSREKLQRYQLEKLNARLIDAHKMKLYEGKPIPSQVGSLDDWQKIPLLTKRELLAAPKEHRINSDYTFDGLIESKSSGSTGQALDVYYDPPSFNLFILAGLRLYTMAFAYLPWHRQTYIYTSPYPLSSLGGAYPMEFLHTLTPIPETLAKLRANPPDLLVCYPSHLRAIVDQMTEEDFKKIRPIAVNVNSEMSSAAERKYLGEKLHSFVFDDYSSEELTRIASQCRHLNYHIFDDINYMEVVDDQGRLVPEGTVGNLVGTNLHNRGMVLLRYLQGDRGSIRTTACPCGRTFRILEKLEGRKNDSFLLPGGGELSSGFLLDLTYSVILDYDHAVQAFCLLQERPEHWTLEVVPGSHWSSELAQKIPADLARLLKHPEVTLELKIVEQVSRTASGKANPIISRIRRNS